MLLLYFNRLLVFKSVFLVGIGLAFAQYCLRFRQHCVNMNTLLGSLPYDVYKLAFCQQY